jgi:hypothetical protein
MENGHEADSVLSGASLERVAAVSLANVAERYAETAKEIAADGVTPDRAMLESVDFREIVKLRALLPAIERDCAREGCGKRFSPSRRWQRYCSEPCRQADHYRRTRKG